MKKTLLLLTSCFFCSPVSAENQGASELDTVRSHIQSIRETLRQITGQKQDINSQLADIEKQYGEVASLCRTLQKQVDQNRGQLEQVRLTIQQQHDAMAEQQSELSGQIKAAYAMGKQEKLKLLLNQQNPALSNRMLVYYEYLNNARLKKLDNIKAGLGQLTELDQQQQEESAQLERHLEQKKIEQMALEKVRNQRNQLLAQLNSEYSSNEQRLQQLNDSESKLGSLVDSLQTSQDEDTGRVQQDSQNQAADPGQTAAQPTQSPAEVYFRGDFSKHKGELPWPVKGVLANKFGSARLQSQWDGVLIEAREGTDIHAVGEGAVVYSDWLRGYGLLTIIDHGGGFMSLYAFNLSLYKKQGDKVSAGEVIASVGQSGGRERPGLYFGIRKKGRPVDPLEWCRKLVSENVS
ncbi:MAG: peptidoglycan DD-metalloendopeptidase family protein [Methylococcaceae bacterium]|jgi:septal ring factor EnvC (AmiA/AmiB activator)